MLPQHGTPGHRGRQGREWREYRETESCSQSDFWSGEEYAGGCSAQRGGAGDTEGKSRRGSFAPIREMAGPGPGRCQETPGGARGPPEIQEGGMEDSLRGTEEQHP